MVQMPCYLRAAERNRFHDGADKNILRSNLSSHPSPHNHPSSGSKFFHKRMLRVVAALEVSGLWLLSLCHAYSRVKTHS